MIENNSDKASQNIGNQKRILIVEDSPDWQVILKRTCQKMFSGCETVVYDNADSVIKEISEHSRIDCVLADYQLVGDHTGLDIWYAINKIDANIPYVILSGSSQHEIFEKSKPSDEFMIPCFIRKPQQLHDFPDKLRKALELDAKTDRIKYTRANKLRWNFETVGPFILTLIFMLFALAAMLYRTWG